MCCCCSSPAASQDLQRSEALLTRHLERDAVMPSSQGMISQAALSALTQLACWKAADSALTARSGPLSCLVLGG